MPMRSVSVEQYSLFLDSHDSVKIAGRQIRLSKDWHIDYLEPTEFVPKESTVWSFPDRGYWATHRGDYPGNWSPYVVRNLLEKYSRVGDRICDPMVGSGTTLIECKLLHRSGLGADINPDATMICMNRLDFSSPLCERDGAPIQVYVGDARNLDAIVDGTIDLLLIHPPYSTILRYSQPQISGDISFMENDEYLIAIRQVASECYRILKPGKICAVLIGDTRFRRHYVPISVAVLHEFLSSGFIMKEDIIKIQHNVSSERTRWPGSYDFYKIAHEHIFIFRKSWPDEDASRLKNSKNWWMGGA